MKILFVNGSRGEWGYIRPIIKLCVKENIEYGVCATNMLLLPSHGSLIDEIKNEGFNITDEIYMSLEGQSHLSQAKSLGIFLTSFTDTLARFKPDWVVLAGDRGEMMMAAIAGAFNYTPTAHIQAGERSGNIDGMSRHAIGKYAHIHFAANTDAAKRLVKLGEEEFRVFNTGAPQLDEMMETKLPSRSELEEKYALNLSKSFFLIVQHPVTEEYHLAREQVRVLYDAINKFDHKKIWIMPNNDAGGEIVKDEINNNRKSNIYPFANLTRSDYLGFLKYSACIIGNSSSGILEAPTYKKPAVNIGRRQADRLRGENVIDTKYEKDSIVFAINKALSSSFQNNVLKCINPYGDGQSAKRILDILSKTKIDDKLLIKSLTY